MKTATKLFIIMGMVFLSPAIPLLAQAQTQPNDYIAFVFNIVDFKPVDEDTLNIQYQVGYIPMTGSATYTYDRVTLSTNINLSNPATITPRMKTTVLDFARSKGYNVKSIVYQDYNIARI